MPKKEQRKKQENSCKIHTHTELQVDMKNYRVKKKIKKIMGFGYYTHNFLVESDD
jgi:hypothetical protein